MSPNQPAKLPPYFLGIDVGGTNTKVGIVDQQGSILGDALVPTDAYLGITAGIENIGRAVDSVLEKTSLKLSDIHSIGMVSAGTIDPHAGRVILANNLRAWQNHPLKEIISQKFGKPTAMQNDANAAALGEYWAGGGQGAEILLVWTIGTGLGSGIVIDGKIISGSHFHGAECGHMIIQADNGRLCSSGQYGTLEAYVGGLAIVSRTKEKLQQGHDSCLKKIEMETRQLTTLDIMEAAELGDELATNIIVETARYLALGTVSMMHILDPDKILIGGAVNFGRDKTKTGKLFLETLRFEVKNKCFAGLRDVVCIDWAKLGSDAGFVGAAACARREFYIQKQS